MFADQSLFLHFSKGQRGIAHMNDVICCVPWEQYQIELDVIQALALCQVVVIR